MKYIKKYWWLLLVAIIVYLLTTPPTTDIRLLLDNQRRQDKITADSLIIIALQDSLGTLDKSRILLSHQLDSMYQDTVKTHQKYVKIRSDIKLLSTDGKIEYLSKRLSK